MTRQGRLIRLDDLRHRAMCVVQAPDGSAPARSIRELGNILVELCGEISQLSEGQCECCVNNRCECVSE